MWKRKNCNYDFAMVPATVQEQPKNLNPSCGLYCSLTAPLIQGWCLGIKITNIKLYATFFFNWKGDRIFHQEVAWWQKTNDHFRVSQRIRIRLGSYSTLINGPVCVCLFIYFLLARALLLYQTRLVAFLWWC